LTALFQKKRKCKVKSVSEILQISNELKAHLNFFQDNINLQQCKITDLVFTKFTIGVKNFRNIRRCNWSPHILQILFSNSYMCIQRLPAKLKDALNSRLS